MSRSLDMEGTEGQSLFLATNMSFLQDHEKFCLVIDMNDIYGSHLKVGYVDVGNGAG